MRYVITGGDNGYCARCGGLCDRTLLEIDDKNKTYKGINGGAVEYGLCLGKFCWYSLAVGSGWFLKRYEKTMSGEYECYGGNKYYLVYIDEQGNEVEKRKIVVKGNKWGKDGEFKTWRGGQIVWDKIQNYKFVGWGDITK